MGFDAKSEPSTMALEGARSSVGQSNALLSRTAIFPLQARCRANSHITKLPPALPRGDRAGDGFTANRQSTENTPGLVPTAAKSVEYSPALFQVPVAGFGRSGNALAVSASQAAKASDADALPATGYDFPSSPRGLQNGRQRARIENAPIRTWAHTWDWYLHDVRVSPKARQEAQVLPQQNEQGAIQPAQVIAFPGGQLRQGTVCARVGSSRQTVNFPAALLTPHKAGTAGPQTNPPQGGGQLQDWRFLCQ